MPYLSLRHEQEEEPEELEEELEEEVLQGLVQQLHDHDHDHERHHDHEELQQGPLLLLLLEGLVGKVQLFLAGQRGSQPMRAARSHLP